jgi:hypothetical protein
MGSMARRTALVLSVIVLMITGCGFEEEPGAGPCVHQFLSPVLAIVSVSDSNTGGGLSKVTLGQLAIDGVPVRAETVAEMSSNVVVDGGLLQCTVPCAFGTQEGIYTFVASAAGYKPADVSVEAQYTTFIGGCPSSSSGSVNVSIVLAPE